ncbi:MAG: Rrf2 family transcriptional regulator [Symbiobacteriaceae bacterium]|nr:Rrf2 family transcriptional regulator [Symbiobacteriaceae bacterium]
MKFSTRSEYGLRALAILAKGYGEGPIPLRQMAKQEGISEHYLEQLFGDLKRAEVLIAVRGASGGYLLARPPQEVTLKEVVTALEGEIAPCDCVRQEAEVCIRGHPCMVQAVWLFLQEGMKQMLQGITLRDMIEGKI